MADFHGIIFAYGAETELGGLVQNRTSASLPFCARYRLIDFALSSLANAGIYSAGVIMQRDYQSLLDHLGSGKDWDMSRSRGGLRMLPPFGLPEYHTGNYFGTIEALNAVERYIHDIKENNIILMRGNLAGNIDLSAAIRSHRNAGTGITAICTENPINKECPRYVVGTDGLSKKIVFSKTSASDEVASLETYIISKDLLVSFMEDCKKNNHVHFHRDAIAGYLDNGGKINIYTHYGFARKIVDVQGYYEANMDLLNLDTGMASVFPASRPVRTKSHEDVSTYYGENSCAKNTLIADGSIIEGSVINSVIASGCEIAEGAELKGCILMRGVKVGKGAKLENIIIDKYVEISEGTELKGSPKLPHVIPKGTKI